jgi:hypothetical protein
MDLFFHGPVLSFRTAVLVPLGDGKALESDIVLPEVSWKASFAFEMEQELPWGRKRLPDLGKKDPMVSLPGEHDAVRTGTELPAGVLLACTRHGSQRPEQRDLETNVGKLVSL